MATPDQPVVPATPTPAPSINTILQPTLPVNPQNVLATSNIQQATTTPLARPDDLLGIYKQVQNELGVGQRQSEYQTALTALDKAKATAQSQQNAIENLPQALNVIRGEQAQASRLSSANLQALSDATGVAQSALIAAQQEAQTQYGIRANEVEAKRNLILQYPGAKIKFGDSFEKAASKLRDYQEQVEKDEYKKVLKTKALELGLKSSGTRKELEKRIRKASKEALSQAKEERELKLQGLRMDIENTRSQISERGKTSGEDSIYGTNVIRGFSSIERGSDGYINPNQFRQFASDALNNARTSSERELANYYISQGYKLLNPADKGASNDFGGL
jgi:hypothetical protein